MTNRFAKAKKNAGSEDSSKNKKGTERYEIQDLEQFAALVEAKKMIEAMLNTMKGEVNARALDKFIERGNDETFEGVEGNASASCQLKKRPSRSTLSEQERETLEQHGISTELSSNTVFHINQKYASDDQLLEKVSKALDKVKDIPDDFIQMTPEKYVTTNNSLNETFKVADKEKTKTKRKALLEELLPIVSTVAVRTKVTDTETIQSIVKKVVQ